MLWSNFELTAHMVFAQFPEKFILPVCKQVIKSDPGADEHFFHSRDVPQFLKERYIITVVRIQIPAWIGKQALTVPADAMFHLFFAGRMPEVCGRSTYIMDISLEILFFCDNLCFSQQ